MELVDVDPGLADKLKESGRDIRQVALAVVEVLKSRGLIEAEKHTTGESQVNSDKQSSMVQGNAQQGQGGAPQNQVFKGQVSLKAFMPQEGSKQASKQVNSKLLRVVLMFLRF